MDNYANNDTFEFGVEQENDYESVDMFNTEVYGNELNNLEEASNVGTFYSTKNLNTNESNNEYQTEESLDNETKSFNSSDFHIDLEQENIQNSEDILEVNSLVTQDSKKIIEEAREEIISDKPNNESNVSSDFEQSKPKLDTENLIDEEKTESIEVEFLEEKNNSFDKKTEELSNEINSEKNKIQMSEEDLSSLTTFEEDKVEKTDIKELFDRVGINVKEASDVFKRNTEMKEKLDSRFEELKKLQLEVARKKEEQYEEINSYKEEVLSKLTEKKAEIEKRLNKLKEFQSSLEKEKEEFEQYRKKEKEEIERVQKEVQEAYDSRREELNHIEDVLRRQKDLLDEERSQLSLDKIQYESDKNELANNLLKFNEIVGSFTHGIDKFDKE